jgi:hypothetical protein
MNLKFFQICCKITAIGNLLAGIISIASISMHLEMNYVKVETNPVFNLFYYGFWVLVATMGIAYWELSKNLVQLRVIALIGAIGKLTCVGLWLNLFFTNQAKPIIWATILYDTFFGIVLAVLYWKTRGKNE